MTKYSTQGIELELHLISSTVHGLVFFCYKPIPEIWSVLNYCHFMPVFITFLFVPKYLESCVMFTVHISIWCSVINTFPVVLNVVQNVL